MIVTRAAPADLVRLYVGLGIKTPRADEYQTLMAQLALGPAWCFRPAPDDPIAALAGIVHGLESVTWFRSGAGAERVMPGLVRAFRALLAREAAATGARIVTWEQTANPVGQRIARALGFRDTGRRVGGGIEVWAMGGCSGKSDGACLREHSRGPLLGQVGAQAAEESR